MQPFSAAKRMYEHLRFYFIQQLGKNVDAALFWGGLESENSEYP